VFLLEDVNISPGTCTPQSLHHLEWSDCGDDECCRFVSYHRGVFRRLSSTLKDQLWASQRSQ